MKKKTGSKAARSFKFPKKARLLTSQEFLFAKQSKTRVVGKFLILAYRTGEPAKSSDKIRNEGKDVRLGIVASRSVGNSVVRNRIKRAIREFFRLNREKFPKGDTIVIMRPRVKADTAEIKGDLERILLKITEQSQGVIKK